MPVTVTDGQAMAGGHRPQTLSDELWARYRRSGDPAARSQLLDSYLGLVHHYAHEARKYAPPDVELDDLISAGTVGLIQALESYDPARGVAFSSFAVPRIRGAILDELRSRSWMPRGVKARARELARAEARLQQQLGRAPTPAEVAAELGVSLATFWRWRDDREGRTLVQLDHPAHVEQGQNARLADTIPDPQAPEPGAQLNRDERRARVREALAALPPKERMVLLLYFYEEANLKQIGEVLHLSESRVSQIRTQALQRLRRALQQEDW
jgi:RNA polymerase sigma factor for flagellar operon FliA